MKRNKVNKILFRKGLTGKEAAEAIGIEPKRFYLVTNDHDTTPWVRKAIADYLGVDPKKLWHNYGNGQRRCARLSREKS
ncbi:MAG TPA: hypothetical protein VJZ02_02770 [Candidatus Brocadiales bacterium]|nr:hypothetical protein [Candidatus Brocadiales bacterium]